MAAPAHPHTLVVARMSEPKPKPVRKEPKEYSGVRAAARLLVPLLIERDGLDCKLCGEPIDPTLPRWRDDDGLQVDHRHPLSKGGTNALDNLQLAHWRCNKEKGARLAA
jgi:5-methylcytosine-specific restriction endonuclease McrA